MGSQCDVLPEVVGGRGEVVDALSILVGDVAHSVPGARVAQQNAMMLL